MTSYMVVPKGFVSDKKIVINTLPEKELKELAEKMKKEIPKILREIYDY